VIKKNWFENSYRRNLVDMHIEDWDDEFLSKFDPNKYVEMLKLSNIQTAQIYANSHVGLCYWPTRTGEMHKGLKGKDIFGELSNLCHKENLSVVAYYSGIYNNWAYENYPAWRTIDLEGGYSRDVGKNPLHTNRYGLCCPNSEQYRDFVKSQLKELIENYKFEGIFIDMTFWPLVCYCNSCKERYSKEVGGYIPSIINWNDLVWTNFQAKRVEWINEYANYLTNYIKSFNDNLSVQHNYSLAMMPWLAAVDEKSSDAHDYLGGDRYGGFIDQSFVCKLYYNLTKNFPFEYMSSRCQPNLREHTTIKSEDMLKLHTYLAMAHNAAFVFIDAIEPAGTLNRKVYERMGEIFNNSKNFESFLGGNLIEDIAIYFSFNSKVNLMQNNKKALLYFGDIEGDSIPHIESAIGAAGSLKENHIPFGVISKKILDNLSKYRTIVLPSIDIFDSIEIESFSDYVKKGGTLYISGKESSKVLGDILGIKYVKQTEEGRTYMASTLEGSNIMPEISSESPLSIHGSQAIVEKIGDATVLAKIVLPYTNPNDGLRFASIHSNPPGIYTDFPSIIYKKFEKGKIIWSSFPIECIDNEPHKTIFLNLLKVLNSGDFSFKSDAPAEVEIILFVQPDNNRYILNLLNLQEKTKILPVYNFKVSVNIANKKIKEIIQLPEKSKLDYKLDSHWVEIYIDKLDIFKMIAIDYV